MTNENQNLPLLIKQAGGCVGCLYPRQRSKISVQYLGNVHILRPLDLEMCGSVVEIYDNFRQRSSSIPVHEISTSGNGIFLTPKQQGNGEVLEFKINKIMCCGVDYKNRRILVFNYHESVGSKGRERLSYRTHAIRCDTKKSAKYVAMYIKELFKAKVSLKISDNNDHLIGP